MSSKTFALSLAGLDISHNGSASKNVNGVLVASWSWPRPSGPRLLTSAPITFPNARDARQLTNGFHADFAPAALPLFWEDIAEGGPFPQKLSVEVSIIQDFSLFAKFFSTLFGVGIGMVDPAWVGKVMQLFAKTPDGKYSPVIAAGEVDFGNPSGYLTTPVEIPLHVPKEIIIQQGSPEGSIMDPTVKLDAGEANGSVRIHVVAG